MNLTIHRGSKEIGGTCIELCADNGFTLLLDAGLPLSETPAEVDLGKLTPDAVLFSHTHQDHCGLLEELATDVSAYVSPLMLRLLNATLAFRGKPLLTRPFAFFKAWEPFDIGPFHVVPHLVDHSSPEAFAFEIEADGKRLFYSGDFRGHGRKGKLFAEMLKNPPANVDVMLMEGTMMERGNDDFPSETDVELRIQSVLDASDGIVCLISSSQNIDRIVSACRACLKTQRTLVIDVYTAWVLECMKIVSKSVPEHSWDQVRVYISKSQYEKMKENREHFGTFMSNVFKPDVRIRPDEIEAAPGQYLRFMRLSNWREISKYARTDTVPVIYSQWRGYLEETVKPGFGVPEFNQLRDDAKIDFIYAHTSGHAPIADLAALAEAIQPRHLIPIHTEYPEEFKNHFKNVKELGDGEVFALA